MRVLDLLADRLGYVKRGPAAPPWLQALGAVSRWELPDGYQVEQQGDLYTRLSWVQVAVSAVASAGAGVPFGVHRRIGEQTRDIPNHPFELLLLCPNPFESRFELLRDLLASYRLHGNAYLWLSREHEHAAPDELFVLPSQHITPVPDGRLGLAGYLFDSGYGPEIPLQTWEVCHLRTFNPLSRFVGLSPLEAIQIGAQGDLAAQQWSKNFYGKDNAKIPGALAFKDMISDPQWQQIKSDLKNGWGGSNRSGPLLLRGVGAGGVDWVAMGLSQNDMQYLESRAFTKEEIFALFAPGLASTLAINATEANSTAGKATFIEFAVWPLLSAFAEKITNDILPVYGRNLVGTFDDIRPTDTQLELAEQDRAQSVLTIDELREKYYQLAPLPDGRGARLLSEPVPSAGVLDPSAVPSVSVSEDLSPKLLADGDSAQQIKAATLLPDEAGVMDAIDAADQEGATLDTALQVALEVVVAREATRICAPWNISIRLLPLTEWLAAFLPTAQAALAMRPPRTDPTFQLWLSRAMVEIVTRCKAWITEHIAAWLPEHPEVADRQLPQFELVWAALLDGHACADCQALDGLPKDQIPPGLKPGGVHPFCRCRWELQALPMEVV